MTVVVGYAPGQNSSGGLELGASIAQARHEDLLVVAVIPPRWTFPSMARHVDGEFADWSQEQGENALARAKAALQETASDTAATFRSVDHKSAGTALLTIAEEIGASVVVIGSSEDARRGQVEVGSTGTRLLHSAKVPVAIAPRGYSRPRAGFTKITCSVADEGDVGVITASAELAAEAGVPLRLVTFAVRLDTMYPSSVGYDAEDELVDAARQQGSEYFARLKESGVIDDGVETVVALGAGWRAAMESIPWEEGELLVLGSHPTDVLTRVFLGTHATKIIRHTRVPVVVLPA